MLEQNEELGEPNNAFFYAVLTRITDLGRKRKPLTCFVCGAQDWAANYSSRQHELIYLTCQGCGLSLPFRLDILGIDPADYPGDEN